MKENKNTKIDVKEKSSKKNKTVVNHVVNPSILSKKIIGVGGGGSNAVDEIYNSGRARDAEFYILNTDVQALEKSTVRNKIVLGPELTKGLGAGANPAIGEKAGKESLDEIEEMVSGADIVFVNAGMGGGTGSGAAPIIAKAAKEAGALVIGIVTTPFTFEGALRTKVAKKALYNLKDNSDSVIVISNDKVSTEFGGVPFTDAFKYADSVLKESVITLSNIISDDGIINLDFADVKTILKNKGFALIGSGRSESKNAAMEAALGAVNSAILDSSIKGAKDAIVMIVGSRKSLTIEKAQEAVETIRENSNPNINIIFGVKIDKALANEVNVSVVATGIKDPSINEK